ncbi:hypothetical protein AB0L53_22035 [Nonomuraea sp. NPDC052129]|uniref:hypothetical protein n=1 Tax=Nonomuraea sp. NPDC052129 TaxID=3154651 RepID=UPI003435DFB4
MLKVVVGLAAFLVVPDPPGQHVVGDLAQVGEIAERGDAVPVGSRFLECVVDDALGVGHVLREVAFAGLPADVPQQRLAVLAVALFIRQLARR